MKEMHFCTELRKSFEAIGAYAYKIPDMPGNGFATRFNPDKPYDMVTAIKGNFIAIECKMIKKWEAFGRKQLRPCQIEGLQKVKDAGSEALVALNIRITANKQKNQKRENRLILWTFDDFIKITEKGSIYAKDLKEIPYIEGRKGLFDINAALIGLYGESL